MYFPLSRVLILGLDQAALSYLPAQYTLDYYKSRGMVPEYKLFESDKPEVLRMLFEFRPPDSQVSPDYRASGPVRGALTTQYA
jgi:hypothetical protein